MTVQWSRPRIDRLIAGLRAFREGCRTTALGEGAAAARSPFRLLVSCVISLRTKDEVTRTASRRLLAAAPTAKALSAMEPAAIADAIYPAGFYNTKARQLRAIAERICTDFDGLVPPSEGALLALPGVGRKTANLVLGVGFGIPAICVDTHVHRISNRLGLVDTGTPEATERALQRVLPHSHWIEINDLLVTFGQHRCHPTSPRCTGCPLAGECPRVGVSRHR